MLKRSSWQLKDYFNNRNKNKVEVGYKKFIFVKKKKKNLCKERLKLFLYFVFLQQRKVGERKKF